MWVNVFHPGSTSEGYMFMRQAVGQHMMASTSVPRSFSTTHLMFGSLMSSLQCISDSML